MKEEREVRRSSKGVAARGLREICGERGEREKSGGYFVYNDDQGSRNVTERVRTNLNTREEHCAPLEMTRGRLVEMITRRSTALKDLGEHCARRLEVAKR